MEGASAFVAFQTCWRSSSCWELSQLLIYLLNLSSQSFSVVLDHAGMDIVRGTVAGNFCCLWPEHACLRTPHVAAALDGDAS